MVTPNLVLKTATGQIVVTGQSVILRVKTAAELRDALQRKQEPIAFDDKRMELLFKLFTLWWIPPALAAYIIPGNAKSNIGIGNGTLKRQSSTP